MIRGGPDSETPAAPRRINISRIIDCDYKTNNRVYSGDFPYGSSPEPFVGSVLLEMLRSVIVQRSFPLCRPCWSLPLACPFATNHARRRCSVSFCREDKIRDAPYRLSRRCLLYCANMIDRADFKLGGNGEQEGIGDADLGKVNSGGTNKRAYFGRRSAVFIR